MSGCVLAGWNWPDLAPFLPGALPDDADLAEEVAEHAAYAPYLARQDSELRELRASEALPLGDDFAYDAIPGLSNEMVERLVGRARRPWQRLGGCRG